ncbi:aconitate hydratase [Bradymonas sediminis]|uniref:Aconitate hydratase n=1 Tax=Bradymonas sediminis TaxID=1548548 RepID=A0A2Z4FRT4_9DELT|nr:aconitate hydratase [Bradymonas sediminis]AWV91434.1 aconitate hydratase [Bradymonas sediminis]TDP75732.1 aconitase [Bradymonas sediminis]
MAQNSNAKNVAEKLIASHLISGTMRPGEDIALKIDQTLTQDATGTAVMLELEAMGLTRVKTELSAQYVDHNLVQQDNKNPDDHVFLRSAAKRWGIWFSRPGNGVSHPVHQEHFGIPGKTLVGSDSHTPAAGALGMLALGAGGLEVALAMVGEPLNIRMPKIWGVKLSGSLPDWVSAKDVILEMLRRHDVDGGRGRIIEYYGPGLANLSVMDRHVIANMGTELGATTTVFPSDERVRDFLRRQGREDDWVELVADPGATYDVHEEIDLSVLEPLCALPSSPGNVVPVREVAGRPIYQAYVGSSANPGWRDFAIVAEIMRGKQASNGVSLDINPASRQVLENLTQGGHLLSLIQAGARLHQAGCNGCIGMGQAPAKDQISLRTVPRNFPSRSGTKDDLVYLVSPETAAASALRGEICDPRDLGMDYPKIVEPDEIIISKDIFIAPLPPEKAKMVALVKGPNIHSLPEFDPLPDQLTAPVALKMGDGVSTDEILRAGAEVLPFRSNIPAISRFTFDVLDPEYYNRALHYRDEDPQASGHSVVAGDNYGQGSSREHAAIAPRFLGLRFALAKSYARIHWQNLANFGVLPLEFIDHADYAAIHQGDTLRINNLHAQLQKGSTIEVENTSKGRVFQTRHTLSERQVEAILAGGLIPLMKERLAGK